MQNQEPRYTSKFILSSYCVSDQCNRQPLILYANEKFVYDLGLSGCLPWVMLCDIMNILRFRVILSLFKSMVSLIQYKVIYLIFFFKFYFYSRNLKCDIHE